MRLACYLMVPVEAAATNKKNNAPKLSRTVGAESADGCASSTLRAAPTTAHTQSDAPAAFYLPQARFWELLAGAVLVCLSMPQRDDPNPRVLRFGLSLKRLPLLTNANARSVLGGLFLACGLLVITDELAFPGWWALLPVAGAVLLISAGQYELINEKILSTKVEYGSGKLATHCIYGIGR